MVTVRRKRVGWFVTAMMMVLACSAWGKVIYVDDDAPAPGDGLSWGTAYTYLQDALTTAKLMEKPVEIWVAQGTYKPDRSAAKPQGTGDLRAYFRLVDGMSLMGGFAGLFGPDPNARDIHLYQTVLSGDLSGDDAPVIDASLLENEPTRDDNSEVVRITSGEVRLEGCTITGGGAGGLRVGGMPPSPDSAVRISDCTLKGNCHFFPHTPGAGGANVYAFVDVVFARCSFIENGGFYGAMTGVSGSGHTITLDDCQFVRNYAEGSSGGGAAYLMDSIITNCVFAENRATNSAGALRLTSFRRTSRVVGCVFRRNRAEYGGALLCVGDAEVEDCVFVGNEGAGGAGAQMGSDVRLVNCLLIGNRNKMTGQSGAWAVREHSSLELVNCTICGNRSLESRFLAVDVYSAKGSSRVAIRNCIISNGGDEIGSNGSPVEITYSCIPGGPGSIGDPNGGAMWGVGNLDADPGFADPGYWDPNGTPHDPNDDFFVEGDYHLMSQAGRWDPVIASWLTDDVTSPCIDAGDPDGPVGLEPFPNGGRNNMGAYGGTAEASKSYFGEPLCETIIAGDINGDCRVDFVDLALLMRHWLETGEHAEE